MIPFREQNEVFHISFSAGICSVEHKKISWENVLNFTDQALYIAKNNGRSKAELATSIERQHVIALTIIDREQNYFASIQSIVQTLEPTLFTIKVFYYSTLEEFYEKHTFSDNKKQYFFIHHVYNQEETYQLLQFIKTYPHTTITLLTSRMLVDDIPMAIQHGADDYIPYPVKINDLENRIYRYIYK